MKSAVVHAFMPVSQIDRYVPLMRELGVSTVARSSRGFLTAYRRAGSPPINYRNIGTSNERHSSRVTWRNTNRGKYGLTRQAGRLTK